MNILGYIEVIYKKFRDTNEEIIEISWKNGSFSKLARNADYKNLKEGYDSPSDKIPQSILEDILREVPEKITKLIPDELKKN